MPSASGCPPITSVEEAEGVRVKMLSAFDSVDTATQGVVVTVPISICIPQSLRLL